MSDEGEIVGHLRLTDDGFRSVIESAKAQLRELTAIDPKVKVTADTVLAQRQLETIDAVAARVARESPSIDVRANTAAARAQLDAMTAATARATTAEGRLRVALTDADRAAAASSVLQARLEAAHKAVADTAVRVAAAETALREQTERAESAAVRATAAEDALARAQKDAAAAALEQAGAEDVAAKSTAKAGQSAAQAVPLWQVVTGLILGIGPALIPIAGVAVAGAGALGLLGGAGILAGTGIARGLKDGSGAASQYRPLIDQLLVDVHTLQDTAAVGLLPGAQQTVSALRSDMPGLNRLVGEFAGDLGNMLPTGLDAVVTLVERGVPLWRMGATELGHMVDAVDRFAHSNGYQSFIDYSVKNGPQVERFLAHVVQLAGDILTAWAPYGATVLPVLDDTVVAVDDIVKAAGPLIPVAGLVLLGFQAWRGIGPIVTGLTAKVTALGAAEVVAGEEAAAAGAAAKAGGAAAAVGWVAAALAATQYADAMAGQANYNNAQKLTPGSATRKQEVASMASRASSVAPASVGGGGMDAGLGAAMDAEYEKERRAASGADGVTAAQKRLAAQQAAVKAAITSANAAYSAQVVTVNNDAAALVKASAAALGIENSNNSAKDAIAGLTAAVKANGTSLDQDSAKGRANREAIAGAVGSIEAAGKAYTDSGGSAAGARIKMDTLAVSLVNTAVKAGISRAAAEALIGKLLGLPKNVSPSIDLKHAKADQALVAQKKALAAFANGDYTAALKGNSADVKAKVADAQKRAVAMAHANYTAFLKANPGNANSNTADAARKARSFAAGAYTAAIRANAAPAVAAAAAARAALNSLHDRTVTIHFATSGSVNNSGTSVKGFGVMAKGGTAPGLAYGGTIPTVIRAASGMTVSGAGSAATDTAGLFRLANREEIISNLFQQAEKNRPMLKAINSGDDSRIRRTAAEQYGAGSHGATTTINRTMAPQIHIHNPVAVDPVTQSQEAVQYALAYAGLA